MKTFVGLALSAALVAACAHPSQTAVATNTTTGASPVLSGTTWDGVYTTAQAARGEALYKSTCMRCHGPELQGGDDGAPLRGPDFMGDVSSMTLGQLHGQIQLTMPPDHPKSLSPQQVSDVISYILSQNNMPAGAAELAPNAEQLQGIKITAAKP